MKAYGDSRLLLVEYLRNRLRVFDPTSRAFSLVAGNGGLAFGGDGGPARLAGIFQPMCATMDRSGDIFVCDFHNRIRRIDAKTGTIATVAEAESVSTTGITVDSQDNLFIGDAPEYAGRIRRVDLRTGASETIAGTGRESRFEERNVVSGPALKADLFVPMDLMFDPQGRLVFLNGEGRVCRIDLKTGILTTIAGTGKAGYDCDAGPATRAHIDASGLALDPSGNLFLADWMHNRVRRVDAVTGIITTIAGTGPERKVGAPVH